jgi:hypothetical protein
MSQLWDEVADLLPGTLLTESEASGYVAGNLSPEEMERVERLLVETPEFAKELRRTRREFAAFFPPEKLAEIEQRFRATLQAPGENPTYT